MGGDQGFVPLTLEKSEDVSHNTKKLYFKVSGGMRRNGHRWSGDERRNAKIV